MQQGLFKRFEVSKFIVSHTTER